MSSRSCATASVRSCGGSVRLGAALAGGAGGAHEVVLDALYERKHDKKTVRVLTVIVYVFCVSLAAIMLSLYYVFFWEPKDSQHAQRQVSHTVRRPPTTTTPLPTCFMPHTGRSSSPVDGGSLEGHSTESSKTGENAYNVTSERPPPSSSTTTERTSSPDAMTIDNGTSPDDHRQRTNGTDT